MNDPIQRCDDRRGVTTVTIHHPDKLNALDRPSADQLREVLLAVAADETVNVVVLRGGGKAFSAGLDLSEIDPEADINLGGILQRHIEPLLETVRSLAIPAIAAVQGPTAGVSVALALVADLCIAAENAYFLLPFTALGLIPDGGLTWLLPRLAGAQRASAAALLGGAYPCSHRRRMGFDLAMSPARRV